MKTLRNAVIGVGAAMTFAMLFALSATAQQPAAGPTAAPVNAVPGAPTIDQSLEMKSAGAPRISPDGRWVAYEITRTNWDANAFERELWIADTNSGQRMRLTSGKGSSFGAQWSPDGQWIAFLSDRPAVLAGAKEGKTQIWLIAAAGGEARELTKVETGVDQFEWAPNGKIIAFTSSDPESKARKDRTEKYGEIQIISGDYSMAHLWLLDVPGADADAAHPPDPKRLTEGNTFTIGGFSWAPDSARIAFSAQRDPDLGSADTADIYVVSLADKSVKRIVETSGPDSDPVWSPDGTEIAYSTANANPNFFYTNSRIAIVAATGGAPRVVSGQFDEEAAPLAWGPDGIYFGASQRTYAHLFRLNPKTAAIERVSSPDALIAAQFSITRDFRRVAFVSSTDNTYPEISVSTLRGFSPRALTDMGGQLKSFKPAIRERIEWTSNFEGKSSTIEGILLKPADFDPTKKYPLLVVIHGGPTGVDRANLSADRYYPVEMFVAKGALVLKPNYRGSAGYGEAFRSLNVRNLGTGDYNDVISGVDFLIAKGWVDRDRVASMGWSEGGYISAFITTFSDRFKAVSVGAGISDWMTYYVNTDIHPFTRQYLQATPWDDPEIYKKTSPITYVKQAKTPTLIQHGGSDRRVPIPNGFELYQALRDQGVPVRMVVYPGFGHPINKPKQQRSVMEENLRWFGHYIWGEPLGTDVQ
jgi:dipeptidyl aminopeptidase/acylaminoacyl peptidase